MARYRTITDAARTLGVHTAWLRTQVQRGTIRGHWEWLGPRQRKGRWQVDMLVAARQVRSLRRQRDYARLTSPPGQRGVPAARPSQAFPRAAITNRAYRWQVLADAAPRGYRLCRWTEHYVPERVGTDPHYCPEHVRERDRVAWYASVGCDPDLIPTERAG